MEPSQSEGSRDALAMLLYSRLFDWLVAAVNENIVQSQRARESASMTTSGSTKSAQQSDSSTFIGILDIYGFESFEVSLASGRTAPDLLDENRSHVEFLGPSSFELSNLINHTKKY